MNLHLTREILIELAQNRDNRDLAALAPAFSDIGRSLVRPSPTEVRATLSAIAALRESLEWSEPSNRVPLQALRGDKSGAYSGGALWSATVVLGSLLTAIRDEDKQEKGFSQRHRAREAVIELAAKRSPISPTDVRLFLQQQHVEAKADTVSKAISELLAVGALEAADPPSGGDRRLRYYRAATTSPTEEVIAETRERATAALRDLAAMAGPDSVRETADAVASGAWTRIPSPWRAYATAAARKD